MLASRVDGPCARRRHETVSEHCDDPGASEERYTFEGSGQSSKQTSAITMHGERYNAFVQARIDR
jgi:hypothetical protein